MRFVIWKIYIVFRYRRRMHYSCNSTPNQHTDVYLKTQTSYIDGYTMIKHIIRKSHQRKMEAGFLYLTPLSEQSRPFQTPQI